MLPGIVIAIPLVQTFNYINLLDTHIGVSIAHILLMLAVIVWVMRAFLQNLPIDLEEAALIDGATRLKIIWSIVLPIARPGIVTVTALSFLFSSPSSYRAREYLLAAVSEKFLLILNLDPLVIVDELYKVEFN